MRAVVTRVCEASVTIDGETVGQIGRGFLVLLGVSVKDTSVEADRIADKLCGLRVFEDENGKMNRSVQDVDGHGKTGGLLLVSQFTLAADCSAGNRPSFAAAASPAHGQELFDHLLERARAGHAPVAAGIFGADMQVALVNDGPVTICLQY